MIVHVVGYTKSLFAGEGPPVERNRRLLAEASDVSIFVGFKVSLVVDMPPTGVETSGVSGRIGVGLVGIPRRRLASTIRAAAALLRRSQTNTPITNSTLMTQPAQMARVVQLISDVTFCGGLSKLSPDLEDFSVSNKFFAGSLLT